MKEIPTNGHGNEGVCTILVVDYDKAMRTLLVDVLQENGCRVVESHDGKGALAALQAVTPKVIVTDLKIPDGGYPYLRVLKAAAPQSPIVVVTAYGDSQSKAMALECGAQGYFEKPLHLKDLKRWISQVCMVNPCRNI
jgi:DNA-binding response OmpR family regulator